MADQILNAFVARGTTAARLAFTPSAPSPASGPNQGYLWWDTDLQAEYAYDFGAADWVLTGGGANSVTAAAVLADNAIVRGDGGVRGVQDSAPVIEDDGRITTVTDPTGLQDASTKNYVDAQIATVNVGGALPTQNTFLVSGGQVVWESALSFIVSAASYYINGVLLSSTEQTVTLDAADPTDDRIDVIVVDDTGTADKITGTPSSSPSEPSYDPSTQVKLSLVSVPAAATSPAGIVSALLYADNAGSPTEWNWTASGSGFDVNSTNNPRGGSTHTIEGTAVTNGSYALGTIGSGSIDINDYLLLILYIQSKASWPNKRTLQIQWRDSGVVKGQAVTLKSGAFGFDSSQTSTYQQIAIPTVQFGVPIGTAITELQIRDAGGAIGFYLDDLSLQGGATSGSGAPGISQDQADARYRQLSVPLVLSSAADVSGDLALANLAPASAASKLLGRGSAAGAGDFQEITLGTGLSFSGTTLNGGSGDVAGPASSVASEIALFDGTTGKLIKSATGTGVAHVTAGVLSASNVVESEITLADNTTNNVSTTKHGFAPKAPNDATQFLDGTGNYSVPTGTGPVSGASSYDYSGAGNPQAVQTATPGKIYLDTATGYRYVKKVGSGNTGWYAVYQVGAGGGLGLQYDEMKASNGGSGSPVGTAAFNGISQTNNSSAAVFGTTWWTKSITNSSIGTRGGWLTTVIASFFANDYDLTFTIRTHTTFTDGRIMVGLSSADLTNSDTLPGDGVAFRYSDGVDGGWVGITRDGTTQSVTASVGSIAVSTNYNLRIRYVSAGTPTIYFSVNDGAETAKTSNLPRTTASSGLVLYIYNKNATTQNLMFRHAGITYSGI